MVQSRGRIVDRNRIFKKRSGCILKKAHELAVLCDIKVCAVIVGPNGEMETRPENPIEAIELLKQFKDNKSTIFEPANFTVNGAAQKKVVVQEAIKIKKLDFNFFDEKLVNGLSKESVLEITKILKSKIEAARNRVELLKKTGKDQESRAGTGFEINPTPCFNQPIFNYSGMMLNFPPPQLNLPGMEYGLNIKFPECYFGSERNRVEFLKKTGKNQESRAGTGFEIKPTPNFNEPIFNYSERMLDFPPPQLYFPGLEYGLNIKFPECYFGAESAYTESHEQVDATDLQNNWNPNFNNEMVLDFPLPSQTYLPGFDSSIRVPDCHFGSESALPLEQVVGLLQPSSLEEVKLGVGGGINASTPLKPLTQQQLDWWFS